MTDALEENPVVIALRDTYNQAMEVYPLREEVRRLQAAYKPQWFSVDDQLPTMFENCIVYGCQERENICRQAWEARRFTGFNAAFDVESEKLWQWLTPCDSSLTRVTHWMPLPARPAAEGTPT